MCGDRLVETRIQHLLTFKVIALITIMERGYGGMMAGSKTFEELKQAPRISTLNPLWSFSSSDSSDEDDIKYSKANKESRKHKKSKKVKKKKHSEDKKKKRSKRSRSNSSLEIPQAKKVIALTMDGIQNSNYENSKLENSHEQKSKDEDSSSSDEGMGPVPLTTLTEGDVPIGGKSYGKSLLPGEGAALAQYVSEGLRIPRRGEVGLTGDDIAKFEDVGYVMSGSRHQRMNAVRLRKENQVYSAEEKQALALANFNEKVQREEKLRLEFQHMLDGKEQERNKNK